MKVKNWGLFPVIDADFREFAFSDEARAFLSEKSAFIARGLGRSYGDSSLATRILSAVHYNRFLAFDSASGVLVCQAGVSLAEILEHFVTRGYFLPVTPGTKFVTLGGAVASDVHGKNHHLAGSFCQHVVYIDLMLANGEIRRCSDAENRELFHATCGGMGLTGVILVVALKLIRIDSAYIRQETIKTKNLEEVMQVFEESGDWTYSVAWIDCLARGENLGRSLLMRGEHASVQECSVIANGDPKKIRSKMKLAVPFCFPGFVLNEYSVRAFNQLYYGKAKAGSSTKIIDYESFFYPLDGIHDWNRIYGRRGFTQYQFVLPKEKSAEGMRLILEEISKSGKASFLAVLKLFGKQQTGIMSFPVQGYTLALDFALSLGIEELFKRLDALVMKYEGRLYLTKDVRMPEDMFQQTYAKEIAEFSKLKKEYDPEGKFQSLQSKRLGLG